ncbi:MAG TPA: hypothetical protein VGU01_02930 [Sphingomicrobium sp.]|nr:hypothetical protein [Sphingomicrobium sp.]
MQVFGHLPLKSMRSVRGRRQSNYHSSYFTAVRLIGPTHAYIDGTERGREYIWADVEVPIDIREHMEPKSIKPDGTYRIQVSINTHRKTLAPFLASGDLEWDVRETET